MARKKPKSAKKQKAGGKAAPQARGGVAASSIPESALKLSVPPEFPGWLRESNVALAVAARRPGRLFMIGVKPDGLLSIAREVVPECTALYGSSQTLYLGTTHQIIRLQNALPAGQEQGGFDRLYVSRVTWTTGDLGISDLDVSADGRVVFAASRLGCLATVSEERGFQPVWKPKFLSRVTVEDRCHLTGFAMDKGKPRFITAAGESDQPRGWVSGCRDGGVVLDGATREVIGRGLCLPRSPRIYKGVLWLLNSGAGEFGRFDPATGRFESIAQCAGYPRALSFSGDYALVALAIPGPEARILNSLPLADNLKKAGLTAGCGVQVIDLKSGATRFAIQIQGRLRELSGIATLPDVRMPKAHAMLITTERAAAARSKAAQAV